jgi:hypothetical protein
MSRIGASTPDSANAAFAASSTASELRTASARLRRGVAADSSVGLIYILDKRNVVPIQ